MPPDELKTWILSLTQDIEFIYNGQPCTIIPLSCDDIGLSYGMKAEFFPSIECAMTTPFFDGRSLADIAESIVFV